MERSWWRSRRHRPVRLRPAPRKARRAAAAEEDVGMPCRFSLDKNGFPPPPHGYMVALGGDEHEIPLSLVRRDPTPVIEYYHNNQYILAREEHYVGGWTRGSNLVFEISERVINRQAAFALAMDRDEDKVYDLAGGHDIQIADNFDMRGRRY